MIPVNPVITKSKRMVASNFNLGTSSPSIVLMLLADDEELELEVELESEPVECP